MIRRSLALALVSLSSALLDWAQRLYGRRVVYEVADAPEPNAPTPTGWQ